MRSSISNRQPAATKSSLFQAASSDVYARENDKAEFHHLHIAWAPATDVLGNPRLRMHWLVD